MQTKKMNRYKPCTAKIMLWLIVLLGTFVFCLSSISAYLGTPVLYYNLDSNNSLNITTELHGRNNITFFNGSYAGATGKVNGGAYFNGRAQFAYSQLDIPSSIISSKNRTMSAWVKMNDNATSRTILGYGATVAPYSSRWFNFAVLGTPKMWYLQGNFFDNTFNSISTDRNWHMLTSVYYDGVGINRLYFDGVNVVNISVSYDTASSVLFLGIDEVATAGSYMNGTIDELGIWDYNLNPVQVKFLYQSLNNDPGLFEKEQSYSTIAYSGSRESFSIKVDYDTERYSSITASLIYNNTAYSSSSYASGDDIVFNSSINLPIVKSQTNKTFYWQFALQNLSGSTDYANSSSNNQSINTVLIDNCTTYSYKLLNFTGFDEDALYPINQTIDISVNLLDTTRTVIVSTFNSSMSYVAYKGGASVCILNLNGTYSLDYSAKYYSPLPNYVIEYKNAQNIIVSNTTTVQNINLYSLNSSRAQKFSITVENAALAVIKDAVIDVQRKYLALGQFLSVESPLTDSSGQTVASLVEDEVIYNFLVYKDGILLATFNNYQVQCGTIVTGQCLIQLNVGLTDTQMTDYSTLGNISALYVYNTGTKTISMTFTSTDGLSHTVRMDTKLFDAYGNSTICSTTSTGSSGTFLCAVPSTYGNSTVYTELYSDGEFIGRYFKYVGPNSGDIFGGTKILFAMLMYSTLVLLMIVNPITMLIGAVLGLGLASLFHIIDGGTWLGNGAILMYFLIGVIIIVIGIRRTTRT